MGIDDDASDIAVTRATEIPRREHLAFAVAGVTLRTAALLGLFAIADGAFYPLKYPHVFTSMELWEERVLQNYNNTHINLVKLKWNKLNHN